MTSVIDRIIYIVRTRVAFPKVGAIRFSLFYSNYTILNRIEELKKRVTEKSLLITELSKLGNFR